MKEKTITNKIIQYINDREQGYAVKNHGGFYSNNGEPDIDACVCGVCLKIEVKKPGEEPTRLQQNRLEKWESAGAWSIWTDNFDSVRIVVEEIERSTKKTYGGKK